MSHNLSRILSIALGGPDGLSADRCRAGTAARTRVQSLSLRIPVFPARIGDAQLPHLAIQVAALDLQRLRRAAHIPFVLHQFLQNERPFELLPGILERRCFRPAQARPGSCAAEWLRADR